MSVTIRCSGELRINEYHMLSLGRRSVGSVTNCRIRVNKSHIIAGVFMENARLSTYRNPNSIHHINEDTNNEHVWNFKAMALNENKSISGIIRPVARHLAAMEFFFIQFANAVMCLEAGSCTCSSIFCREMRRRTGHQCACTGRGQTCYLFCEPTQLLMSHWFACTALSVNGGCNHCRSARDYYLAGVGNFNMYNY